MKTTLGNSMRTIPPTKDFQKTVLDHYTRMLEQATGEEPDPSIYFITTMFNDLPNQSKDALAPRKLLSGKYSTTQQNIHIAHRCQYLFYKHILNQTVSNAHYPSKSKHYPIALCFIDFPGSRNHHPRITQMPHFHSIFIIPPKTVPKFKRLIDDGFRLERCPDKTELIQTLNCQSLKDTGQSLLRNLDYNSKFLRCPIAKQLSDETRGSLFVMYGKEKKYKYIRSIL